MKLLNIFKKKRKTITFQKAKKMDALQLSKVIGGAEILTHELAHVKQESTK